MKELAIALRAAQFVAHSCHQLIAGPTFFEDHEFLGEVYTNFESEYDSVIERMIGLGKKVDPSEVTTRAAHRAASIASELGTVGVAASMLGAVQKCNAVVKAEAESCCSEASDGTENLLQTIADNCEMREYKLKQRLK